MDHLTTAGTWRQCHRPPLGIHTAAGADPSKAGLEKKFRRLEERSSRGGYVMTQPRLRPAHGRALLA